MIMLTTFRPVLYILGFLLLILAFAMLIPTFFDVMAKNNSWKAFLVSAAFTAFIGGALMLSNNCNNKNINIKQAFVLTPLSWICLSLFSSFPFLLSDLSLDFSFAFFESVSAITTTGATVLNGIEDMEVGIKLWRILLQYLGGMGIIASALIILPMLGIGGMQLFKTETSDKEKFKPRSGQVAKVIISIYFYLTISCALMLSLAGLSTFDAITHAMTTVSTAGFSNYDASIGYFNNSLVEIIITIFMVLGAMPFVHYYFLVRGDCKGFFADTQVRWFLSILLILVGITFLWLFLEKNYNFWSALRLSAFNVSSVLTTTGFSTSDYGNWGSFSVVLFFMIFCIGGCTGSTTGGIKIFRIQLMFKTAISQIKKLVNPHGVFPPQFNNKSVPESVVTSVLSFFMLFFFSFILSAVLLASTGQDFITAMSTALATLSNVGPALGEVAGPNGNYSSFSDTALYIYCFNMLMGRLELFTLFVLAIPHFWRD